MLTAHAQKNTRSHKYQQRLRSSRGKPIPFLSPNLILPKKNARNKPSVSVGPVRDFSGPREQVDHLPHQQGFVLVTHKLEHS